MKDVLQAIKDRSSTRAYTPEKLTKEELDTLLQAALQAPTAADRQEIHITVADGEDPILAEIHRELAGGRDMPHNFFYEAPTVLMLSGDSSFYWSAMDAGIAAENIALAAEGLGLGSVIIGCIRGVMTGARGEEFSKALRFPEGYVYQVAVAVGHKAVGKEPHTYDAAKNVTIL